MLSLDAAASIEARDRYAAYRDRRHFASLDGLRALSVMAVIWHHTVGHDAALPLLFANGAQGVTLFFAIGGFLIVTLLLRERDGRGGIDLRAFYMRRALRIFPLYYAVPWNGTARRGASSWPICRTFSATRRTGSSCSKGA